MQILALASEKGGQAFRSISQPKALVMSESASSPALHPVSSCTRIAETL